MLRIRLDGEFVLFTDEVVMNHLPFRLPLRWKLRKGIVVVNFIRIDYFEHGVIRRVDEVGRIASLLE